MNSVFLLFLVYSIATGTSSIVQKHHYVNEFQTLEQCRQVGIKTLAASTAHTFHCVPAYSDGKVPPATPTPKQNSFWREGRDK